MLWLWGFLQFLFVFSFVSCQEVQDIQLDQLGEILKYVRNFDSKLEAIETRLGAMEGEVLELKKQIGSNQKDVVLMIETSKEAIETRLGTIEDLIAKTSTQEQVSTIEQSLSEGRLCGSSQDFLIQSVNDIIEGDECLDKTHNNCSSDAKCHDTLIGFKCICNPGYTGDGVICQDVDECVSLTSNCSSFARCSNEDGGFECNCLPGYTGDGFNCQVLTCESPSQVISNFGCIIPVKEKFTWDDAQKNCRDQHGGRLIEGINSQKDLDTLAQHFKKFIRFPWLGIHMRWSEGGGEGGYPIDPHSPLWYLSEPNRGTQDCVAIDLQHIQVYIFDTLCHHRKPSLCQKI